MNHSAPTRTVLTVGGRRVPWSRFIDHTSIPGGIRDVFAISQPPGDSSATHLERLARLAGVRRVVFPELTDRVRDTFSAARGWRAVDDGVVWWDPQENHQSHSK